MYDAQDPASGVFVGRGAAWAFLPRGAFTPIGGQPLPPPARRVMPLAPQAALNAVPAADALRALFLTDQRLRAYTFTSAARTPDRSDLFFGTNGMGVIRIDAASGQWEPLRFGLLATGAGGLALDHDDVWVATMPFPGERSGLTLLDNDLTTDSLLEGGATGGFSCRSGRRVIAV
jgi:hypothetical protein